MTPKLRCLGSTSQAGLFSQGFLGSQHSSGLWFPCAEHRPLPTGPTSAWRDRRGPPARGAQAGSSSCARSPGPGTPLLSKGRSTAGSASPAPLPLVPKMKRDTLSSRRCLYKLHRSSHADTVTEVCATQHRSQWFGSSRNMGFASFQGRLSW